jgi:acyl-CoA hydrolase
VDCTLTAAERGRHVIAQVNPNMPRTYGRTHLHVSDVDAVVEVNEPLPELHSEEPDPVCTRIGAHVASLVRDGATLQLGIGAVPDAVLKCLAGHRNLGLHTEMCSDGVIPLVQSGVMNGAVNTLHPGVLMVGFVLGTRRLFDFIDENPLFEFHPIKYVNDPFVVARIDRMTAINSAIQIDLTGQVCSDSIGRRPYSGFGGQVDFIRGAAHARQGVPVIALPSTAKRGTVSRIVPMLDPGAGVVTSRADVHYVVTEFGVAYLHGRNLAARAEALISIADPRFRDALTAEAYAARILRPRLVAVK